MIKKIRFIDSHYNTLFYIENGQSVTVTYKDGEEIIKPCRYIDDYHFYFGNNCYHICEFVEKMERISATYKPSN